ncbi:MAG: four helix bundle protein [Nitrospira sp.]|nr:MAG: four helix bundle protein [Nitrospira sp.]
MPERSAARRFEDLIAWQKARELTKKVYEVTGKGHFAKDFGLRDQVRRSSVSIMANIAEGFERARQSEFHQFLSIAKSSCAERRSHLYVAHDAKYVDDGTFNELMSLAKEVSLVLGGLRSAVQRRRAEQKSHGC